MKLVYVDHASHREVAQRLAWWSEQAGSSTFNPKAIAETLGEREIFAVDALENLLHTMELPAPSSTPQIRRSDLG
jgi:hypothetical protein